MSFTGNTYRVAFLEGGLNGNDNYDLVPPSSFVYPSRNINIHNGGREKRGGTSKVNGTAITASPSCLGIGQFLTTGTNVIVSAHADGKIWKDQATAIKTGMSQTNKFCFTQAGSKMVITDGATAPQIYQGAGSTAAISTSATDWSGANQPLYTTLHARNANRRLVAYGVTGNLQSFYMSANGNIEDFGAANVLKFTLDTNDGYGITGAIDMNFDLFVFGKTRTWILDDTPTSTASWGYYRAPWLGGVAHNRLLLKVENDVYAMSPDGEIYNIMTAQLTNDYKRASITRPSFIFKYINNYVDLTKIDDFFAVYDPNIRCIKWWVTRTGQSLPDTALVFNIDRPVEQAWTIHDGQDNPTASGYCATAGVTITKSNGMQAIYTGDSTGTLWELEKSSKSDNSNAYWGGFRTSWLSMDNPRNEKRFVQGRLVYVSRGAYDLQVRWWVDDVLQDTQTLTLTSVGSVYGTGQFGTAVYGSPTLTQAGIALGQTGTRIQFEIYNNGAGNDFFLSQLLIDFIDRGPIYL